MAPQLISVTAHTAVDVALAAPTLEPGSHVNAELLGRYAAGKGINVSRTWSLLGLDSVALGLVGEEDLTFFQRSLAQSSPGRITPRLRAVAGRTRQNLTILDRHRNTEVHLRTPGFVARAGDVADLHQDLEATAESGDLVALCGSLPEGMTDQELGEMVSSLRRRSALVLLDQEGDRLGRLLETDDAGLAPVWLIKPNTRELAALVGTSPDAVAEPADAVRTAWALRSRVTWVAASLADRGAVLVSKQGNWWARADVASSAVRATVGCGDVLLATLAADLLHGHEPELALQHAVAAATVNAMHHGVAEFSHDKVVDLVRRTPVVTIA